MIKPLLHFKYLFSVLKILEGRDSRDNIFMITENIKISSFKEPIYRVKSTGNSIFHRKGVRNERFHFSLADLFVICPKLKHAVEKESKIIG